MKTVIKNIIDALVSEEEQKGMTYSDTGIKGTNGTWEMTYLELITEQGFVDKIAMYIWKNAPRSKGGKYPKIMWPEGQLKYKNTVEIKEDIKALFGSTIMDNSTEEYLQEFYEKNILPNVK